MSLDSREVSRAHLADAGVRDLPEGWDVIQLGDLLSKDRGISVGVMYPGDHDPEGVPLIKAGDLNGNIINSNPEFRISSEKHQEYRRTELQGGELLMTLVGDVGQCAVVPASMAGWNVARAVAVIRLADPSEVQFVRQCLLSRPIQHLMEVWCNTTVQATLNLKEIRQLPLPWPPEHERVGIAGMATPLDDKISLNGQLNATLQESIRTVFKDWFVDFGPTRAKMDGSAQYLPSDLWAMFPDTLDNAGLPVGWKGGLLGDVAEHLTRTVDPADVASNTAYIGLEHMPRRSIALSAWESAGKVTSGKLSFQKGEFLFGKLRPYFHKVGIAPVDGIASTDIVVCRERSKHFRAFVLSVISSQEFVRYTDQASTGTKMPRTSWGIMRQFKVTVPSNENCLKAFESFASPLIDRIISNVHQTRSLSEVRGLLLPKLMSGEIRVKVTNNKVEEAS
jgi:type I restriction enzyme S subunit